MTGKTQELHNPEFEQAVIGGILVLGTEGLEAALSTGLDFKDFCDERLRSIYRAAIALASAGKEIDYLTVKRELSENDKLPRIDIAFLTSLADGIPRALNISHYADQVLKDSRSRRLRTSLNNALKASMSGNGDFDAACSDVAQALAEQRQTGKAAHQFEQITESRYRLVISEAAVTIEVDRLRREHGELIGELSVRCDLPGISSYDGNLHTADFNFSSARARTERATLLSKRANVSKLDWSGYLEEFCQRVLTTERNGQPAVDLRTLERPSADDSILVEGFRLPRRHPTAAFGDGGAAKSYLGLNLAGRLSLQGLVVALFDWELAGEDHRDRLERLFGSKMPRIIYAKCERPLVHELDRLQRIVRDEKIDYAIFDSVAFACDGPPESAEIAGRYFRAVRQIGIGSFHIAHITKSESGDQKPFGSVFWHNGARATYFVKLAEESIEGDTLHIGLFNRKANLGRLQTPTGFKIVFTADRTYFTKEDPAGSPDLAEKMTIAQRMKSLLRAGAVTVDTLANMANSKPDSIYKAVQRHKRTFTLLEGGKVALLQQVK
jgi:hypothetical protein